MNITADLSRKEVEQMLPEIEDAHKKCKSNIFKNLIEKLNNLGFLENDSKIEKNTPKFK